MWYFGDEDGQDTEESPRPPAAEEYLPTGRSQERRGEGDLEEATPASTHASSSVVGEGSALEGAPCPRPSHVALVVDLSAEQLRQDRNAIRAFLRTHKCYDLMPGTHAHMHTRT